MTLSQYGAYVQGDTHPTMGRTTGCKVAKRSQSFKSTLSSNCGLKFAHMKLELVVIAGQQTAVNTFSPLVHTARQARKVGSGRSGLI
jgi:hypothetical protein